MEVYFDNSATTPVSEEVLKIIEKVMRLDFGNPSSKHMKGVEAERYLRSAGETLAQILKVAPKEIIFTSGGTESNNLALTGAARANMRKGRHIISTCFEHPSVLEPLKYLEKCAEPFEVTYLPVDSRGHISQEDLRKAMRPDTVMVTTMFVNNETGAVQDVAAIGKIIKEINPACIYHVDAIQAFGKYAIFPKKMNIDLMSVSAHKFHGPKGAGFLYRNEKVRIEPLILGGGQQKGMRSGTDNVPGAAGMAKAAEAAYEHLEKNTARMAGLKDALIDGLVEMGGVCLAGDGTSVPDRNGNCPGKTPKDGYIRINSPKGTESAPHIVSVTFFPVKSEVMLHALEDRGIYVSSGSACSSNKPGLSGTLEAIGLSKKEADCTIRFSFSELNTMEEVNYTLEQIREVYAVLKKFTSY